MLIELLFFNPLLYLMIVISILFGFTVHEYSHAQAAFSLGDPTPKYYGRISLNPLAHFDPIFTSLIFIIGVGMGKPVPFNSYNLKNQKWGPAIVALAGPASNLLMATIVGVSLRIFNFNSPGLVYFLICFTWINLALGIFNLIPIPPLDGSHIFFTILPSSFENIKIVLRENPFLILFAIFFMWYIGYPFICQPLFSLITGIPNLPF